MVKKEKGVKNETNNTKRNLIIFILSGILIIAIIAAVFYFNDKNPKNIENIKNTSQNNANNTIETTQECIENWNCGNWSLCINGTETRTCTDQNNCNTTKNKPEVKKNCCFWDCTEWSQCLASNTSFRTCTLPKGCNITEQKPNTKVNCTYESLCKDEEGKIDYEKEGKVTDKNGTDWYDICIDDKTLSEVYCGPDGNAKWKEYICNSTCTDGECD